MLNHTRKFQLLRYLMVATVVLAVTTFPVMAAELPDTPQIVARVNGVLIRSSELSPVPEGRIKQYRQFRPKVTDDESRRRFQLKELDALIAQELLAQAGAALNPLNIEEMLAKRLDSSPDKTEKKTPLAKEQREARVEKFRKDILRDSYLEHKGLLNPTVDEQTLRRFYDENRQSFQESKSVKAAHILIRLPKAPTADQEREAQDRAVKILADLKQGKDFAILAIQSSDCSSKDDGGNLGFIKQGFMPKEFDAVAFKLKPGETSGVVKTRHGLHIIRIEESRPETIREFKEVKEYIAGYLQKEYQRRKVDELVQELRKLAKIEVLIQ